MKALDIVKQLQSCLPKYTDLFSDIVSITSLTKSGTTVTATSAAAHGLDTGDYAVIQGALVPNIITSLTQVNNIATAVTTNEHDLTLSTLDKSDKFVTISGATEPEYNGTKKLLEVVGSKTFKYQISDDPSSPATGTPTLNESIDRLYNGIYDVAKINDTQFSYTVRKEPLADAVGAIKAHTDIRISAGASSERIMGSYTKKKVNKYWAYVLLGQTTASKSTNTNTDAISMVSESNSYRDTLYQDFDVYIFANSKPEYLARDARDNMELVRVYLFKSLLGVKFDTLTSEGAQYLVNFNSDNLEADNGSYIVHKFSFQMPYQINDDDIVEPEFSTAFKSFEIKQLNLENDLEIRNIKGEIQNG